MYETGWCLSMSRLCYKVQNACCLPQHDTLHGRFNVALPSLSAINMEPRISVHDDFSACILLRSCARLLRLPPRATITALGYIHECWRSPLSFDPCETSTLVAACIFLAAKVEEVSLSNNHLLNVVMIVSSLRLLPSAFLRPEIFSLRGPSTIGPGQEENAGNQDLPQAAVKEVCEAAASTHEVALSPDLEERIRNSDTVLVGQEYYGAKAKMLAMEQQVLRALRFKLGLTEQPYTHIFIVLHTLQAPLLLVKAAIAVMNDLATFSMLLLDHPPLHLAVACIHAASYLTRTHAQLPKDDDVLSVNQEAATAFHPRTPATRAWYEAIGVSHADVELLGHAVLDVLLTARAHAAGIDGGAGAPS